MNIDPSSIRAVDSFVGAVPVIKIYGLGKQHVELKTIGGLWIGKRDTFWRLPRIYASIAGLRRLYGDEIVFDSSLLNMESNEYGYELIKWNTITEIDELNISFFDYQKLGIQYLLSSPYSGSLLALSPGLGKTLVSMTAAYIRYGLKANVLIVCPPILIPNWLTELKKWLNIEAHNAYRTTPVSGWNVTNYNTLVDMVKAYNDTKWDLIILDESVLVKNRKSVRTQAVELLRSNTKCVWLLSGSPITRHADDLHEQLYIAYPAAFTSYWRFANEYCHIEGTQWGDKVVGTRLNIKLRNEFKDLMFVRNQKDVMPEIPEMLFETISLELHEQQRAVHDSLLADFTAQLEGTEEVSTTNRLGMLTLLQQATSNLINFRKPDNPNWPNLSIKQDAVLSMLETHSLPLPSILWIQWTAGAKALFTAIKDRELFLKIGMILGETSADDRAITLAAYTTGKLDLLILSLGAGKYGLNLQNSKSAVYIDKTWDADSYVQSLARIKRVGLTHSPVIFSLVALDSVDQLIAENLTDKGRSIHAVTNMDLSAWLKSLRS